MAVGDTSTHDARRRKETDDVREVFHLPLTWQDVCPFHEKVIVPRYRLGRRGRGCVALMIIYNCETCPFDDDEEREQAAGNKGPDKDRPGGRRTLWIFYLSWSKRRELCTEEK